jgi:beta-phosphoglucomutase-like phosphatase (HAD superfamily)
MLELAGLDSLVDDAIDAAVVDSERLRPRPAPDTVLAACSHVGVAPAEAVIFTREPAAVVAAHLANVEAIAVATRGADELLAYGAARVVPSLAALLDRRFVAA